MILGHAPMGKYLRDTHCHGFKLGDRGRRKYPHRCMTRLTQGKDGRKCLRRATFDHWGEHPRCPGCGSRLHWAIDKHRALKLDKPVCTSGSCPILYPHSIHSEGCVNHPSLPSDPFGVADKTLENRGDDPGW